MLWPLAILSGLATGIVGAMFGIGGSVLLIPALNELFGPRQHLHQACAMILNFFVAMPAAWRYSGLGLVDREVVYGALPAAIVGVFGGVLFSEMPFFSGDHQHNLTAVFGLFLMIVACGQLIPRRDRQALDTKDAEPRAATWRGGVAIGLPTGLISGLLGVGGGLVAVPLQQLLLRMPLKRAIANSAMLICGLSLIGAAWKNHRWAIATPAEATAPLQLAAILVPLVIIGSRFGSRITTRLRVGQLRVYFGLFLLIAAIRQIARWW